MRLPAEEDGLLGVLLGLGDEGAACWLSTTARGERVRGEARVVGSASRSGDGERRSRGRVEELSGGVDARSSKLASVLREPPSDA